MQNAHKRKKQPEIVRQGLIDQAARIAVAEGLGAVTVQAVSDAAGVTKGGFMHHFPNKQALLNAVFNGLLESIDEVLDKLIAADPEPYGSFTRSYVEAVMEMGCGGSFSPWMPLSILMLTDASLRTLWAEWFNARLKQHEATDGDVSHAIARLAADGIWLADLGGIDVSNRELLRERLIAQTRP